jgi:hypothetical protein
MKSESEKVSVVPGIMLNKHKLSMGKGYFNTYGPVVLLHTAKTVRLPTIVFPVQTASGCIPILNS